MMDKDLRQKLYESICVGSLAGFTPLFFGATYLYLTNVAEYSSSYFQVFPYFLVLSLMCAGLLTGVLMVLKASIYKKVLALLFTIGLLFWIQGNLLVWDYGLLDGTDINWNANTSRGLIDAGLWAIMLIMGFLLSSFVCRIARSAGIALILIQIVSVSIAALKAPDISGLNRNIVVDEESIFNFSPEKNVLIVILDSFQTDFFQEIINENSHYRDIFDGFTYYPNALGGYPKTYASVSLILSGRYYKNDMPMIEFVKDSCLNNSIPAILKKNGYQVDLVGGGKSLYADATNSSSRVEIKHLVEQHVSLKEAAFILDVALFRYVPHFAKKFVYNNQAWFLSSLELERTFGGFPPCRQRDSIELVTKLERLATVDNNKPTFKYIHSEISHPPIRINERLEYVELEYNRESFKGQAKGSLELVNKIMSALKNLGVYDKTMIFVLADHGAGAKVDTTVIGYPPPQGVDLWLDDFIKGRALPLFLVKPFMSKGEMRISLAPVSLGDVARTVFSELDVQAGVPGTSVLEMKEVESVRERRFLYYWNDGISRKDNLPPIREFIVSGFSWLDDSWRPAFRAFSSEEERARFEQTDSNTLNIKFGRGGNYILYEGKGWSFPDKGYTWTSENLASIIVPFDERSSDVRLRMRFKPFFAPGRLDAQRVRIYVNGQGVVEWTAGKSPISGQEILTSDGNRRLEIVIPNQLLKSPETTISLELPDALPLWKLGIGDDRALGLAVQSIQLTALPPDSK